MKQNSATRITGLIVLLLAFMGVTHQQSHAASNGSPRANSKTVSIPAKADTFIAWSDNMGDLDYFYLGGDNAGTKYTPLLAFDVSTYVPEGSTVLSARLRVTGRRAGGALWGFPFSIYPVSEPWNEYAVTASSSPSYLAGLRSDHMLSETSSVMEFEISDIVQKWVSGEIDNYGLFLFADVIQSGEAFFSRESLSLNGPTLEVDYIPPKSWTIMYFLAEDNDLDDHAPFQKAWHREASNNDHINVVVFFDGYQTEAMYVGLAPSEDDDTRVLKGELSTGDPSVLAEFVHWAQSNYPAEHFALILYDHASGVSGFGFDEHPEGDDTDCAADKACLTFREIQQALSTTPKLDVIFIEDCSSGAIEVAY